MVIKYAFKPQASPFVHGQARSKRCVYGRLLNTIFPPSKTHSALKTPDRPKSAYLHFFRPGDQRVIAGFYAEPRNNRAAGCVNTQSYRAFGLDISQFSPQQSEV